MTRYRKHVYSDGSFSYDPVPVTDYRPWWVRADDKGWGSYHLSTTLEEAEVIHQQQVEAIRQQRIQAELQLKKSIADLDEAHRKILWRRDSPTIEKRANNALERERNNYQGYQQAKAAMFNYYREHPKLISSDHRRGEYSLALSQRENSVLLEKRIEALRQSGDDDPRAIAAERGMYLEIERFRQYKTELGIGYAIEKAFHRIGTIVFGLVGLAVLTVVVVSIFFVGGSVLEGVYGCAVDLGERLGISGEAIANEDLFPDKQLQQYLREKVDSDKNGKISNGEIAATTSLDGFEGWGIHSLEGLEIFYNLRYLDASNAGIGKLFKSHLHRVSILTVEEKEVLPNLQIMDISGNNIEKLAFSDSCQKLEELNCSSGMVKNIEIGKLNNLKVLNCSKNSLEGDLDIANAVGLTDVFCSDNRITYLNLPASVKNLDCSNNAIEKVHFASRGTGSKVVLSSLYCQNNQIVSMVSGEGIAWNNVCLEEDAPCDISNNSGIKLVRSDDGVMIARSN